MLLLILLKNTPGEILLQLELYCPNSYANCFVITSKAALEAIYEAVLELTLSVKFEETAIIVPLFIFLFLHIK